MIYAIIGLGLLFASFGFIINVSNAPYLLSGYNTMSKEDRKKVDIDSLVSYTRRFQILLGGSFVVFGLALTWFIGELAGGVFLAVYPILAYIFFIWHSRKFSTGVSHKWHWVSIAVLVAVLIFVLALFVMGFREDELIIAADTIILEGSYGQELTAQDIKNVKLTYELPPIAAKTNGFALGAVHKGYFRTRGGEVVTLILNSDQMPCILFTLSSGEKIYYTARKVSGEIIYKQIQQVFPDLHYTR